MKKTMSAAIVLALLLLLSLLNFLPADNPSADVPSTQLTQAVETTAPTEAAVTTPSTAPTTEPTVEPTTEPVTEATTEPTEAATEPPATKPAPTEPPATKPTTEPTTEPTTAPTTEPATEPETEPETEPQPYIDPNGSYTTKEDVALYIHLYGKLPKNFITKSKARSYGWDGGSLERYAPGKCIGGDTFGNREGLLPRASGRTYKECDIDTLGNYSGRGAKRIVFSNDGLIYYTDDHYKSFTLLYGEP